MNWVLGGLVFVGVGVLLCRLLRMSGTRSARLTGLIPLSPELHAIYHPLALEVETQAAILGISLNDAFEERDAHHGEVAWRMVGLSAGEWDRLAEIVTGLLNAVGKHLARVQALVPTRCIVAGRFKSRPMIGYAHMHELLDQLVFSSRRRYQLQLRLLRRATETLTSEFRRTYRRGERTQDRSGEVWTNFDLCFHDFDLIAKEALLAFRAFLACAPPDVLAELGADLHSLVQHGVRTPSVPARR
jgi:hypothetical protein